MAAKRRRVYEELRAGIEARGGSMVYVRRGYLWGAWTIRLGDKIGTFPSNGRGFPELDPLYLPRVPVPQRANDYTTTLVEDALERLARKLDLSLV